MRRAERLFQIIQLIRGRGLTTASYLAARLSVSERTVYRDIADMQDQGVPIEGEVGVGYRIASRFSLPPMKFTQDEAQALVATVRVAQSWLDPALAQGAEDALCKIMSMLPLEERVAAESLSVYAQPSGLPEVAQRALQTLREASQERRKVRIEYIDPSENRSERIVWPLACFYWGGVWTLSAWCERRVDFRVFRIDRIQGASRLEQSFPDEPGRRLTDMLRRGTCRASQWSES